jgi:hypothetical protein
MNTKISKGKVVAVKQGADMWRPITQEERTAWHNSDASKGMDCAGESKLCPRHTYQQSGGKTFTVVRSRVRAERGYHTVSHCAEVRDNDNVVWWVKKAHIAVVA